MTELENKLNLGEMQPAEEPLMTGYEHPVFRLEEMVLNMGPQHPSTHGVLRMVVRLDGELVLSVDPVIGYLHRGMEKICENRTYLQYLAMASRCDYLSGIFMEWVYAMCVEQLMELEVPPRAEYLRVITGELNRVISHHMSYGDFLLNLGAGTPMFWAFRDREQAMEVLELLTGQRMMYNYIRVGGVRYDMPEGFEEGCRKFIKDFRRRVDEYEQLVTDNEIFLSRTLGMGVVTQEQALDYGLSGPNIRATGIPWDLRRQQSYSVYDQFDFDIPVGTHGDSFDRYKCRIEEMRESLKIIEQALDAIPGGPVNVQLPPMVRPPAGEVYAAIESPRGEFADYMVSDGGLRPYRLKMRDPSYVAISALPKILPGYKIADIIGIGGSLDLIMGGVDR